MLHKARDPLPLADASISNSSGANTIPTKLNLNPTSILQPYHATNSDSRSVDLRMQRQCRNEWQCRKHYKAAAIEMYENKVKITDIWPGGRDDVCNSRRPLSETPIRRTQSVYFGYYEFLIIKHLCRLGTTLLHPVNRDLYQRKRQMPNILLSRRGIHHHSRDGWIGGSLVEHVN